MKLLLVGNQPDTSALLDALNQNGTETVSEADTGMAAARAQSSHFDLVILDAADAGQKTFAAVYEIRSTSAIPVLVITAAEDWRHRVHAFQTGADDCISRPFLHEELIARIEAIVRRSSADTLDPLSAGSLRFCPASRRAWYNEKSIAFTSMECVIVEMLMRGRGRVVSRDQISLQLYGRLATAFDRTVDTHVSRIRGKLGDGGKLIVSVRGSGYLLSWHEGADDSHWSSQDSDDASPGLISADLRER